MYKVSVSIYLLSTGEIALLPTFTANKTVIEGDVFLFFSGELENDYCDAVLPVEEKSLRTACLSLLLISKL